MYELRIPLQGDDLHSEAVGAGPGERVTITLETSKMEMPERGEGMRRPGGGGGGFPGGGPGGGPDDGFGGGGRGGGPGPGPGGGPGGGMRGGAPPWVTERLDAKVEVTLAASPGK